MAMVDEAGIPRLQSWEVQVANEEKMYEYLQVLTEQAGGETGSSRSLGSKRRKRTPKRNGGE
jgi:hypothetical protein